jgi:hypothetical protein
LEWKFWHVFGPKKITEKVWEALALRFPMSPEEIDRLRLVEKWGQLSALTGVVEEDRRVHFIRIFDPSGIEKERLAELTYDNLKSSGYRKALRFEGHIERDGTVHLADRRPPKVTIRPINLGQPKRPQSQIAQTPENSGFK